MQNLKEFLVKYKMLLGLGVITILLFFCNLWFPMWIISGAVIVLFMFTLNVAENFAMIMYLELYTALYGQYVICIGAGLLSIIVRYIIDVKKKRKKFFAIPFTLTTIIAVVWSCINYSFDTNGFYSGANIIYMLYLVYFVYIYYREIDIAKCFNYLLIGMLVTSGLSILSLAFPTFAITPSYFDKTYHRLQLFTMHMNFLSMLCVFEVVYSIYSLFHKKRHVLLDVFAILVSVILGVCTLSKAFVLLMIFFIIYSIICLIVKYKTRSIKYIVIVLGAIFIICFFFRSYLADIYSRFFIYFKDYSFISQITTGRSDIWQMYFGEIKSTSSRLWFGVGIFSSDLIEIGAHNVAIYVLYRFGIVGVALILSLIASYIVCGKPWFKIRFANGLMCLTWVILSLEEVVLSDKYLFFLLFGIIMMMKEQVDPKAYHEAVNAGENKVLNEVLEINTESDVNKEPLKQESPDIKEEPKQIKIEGASKLQEPKVPKKQTAQKYIVKSKKKLKS